MSEIIEPNFFSWDPDTKELTNLNTIKNQNEDSGETILLMDGHYFDTWGHFILDTVYPFYLLWRELKLPERSFILLCRDRNIPITTWDKVTKILDDLFKPKKIIDLASVKQKTIFKLYRNTQKDFGFFYIDPLCRQIQHNLRDHFKEVSFLSNEIFQSRNLSENLRSFVDHIYKIYDLDIDEQIKENKEKVVTICGRRLNRKIVNLDQVKQLMIEMGFKVEIVYFEDLSFKEQVKQMLRSEYLITTYGSNLTNGIFLRPESKLILLWPKDAKCFWSRKYCILHAAILGRGITIFELDKSKYDQKDRYYHVTQFTGPADYFIRDRNVIKLRKEKKNYQAIMDYPQPAMYDLTNVDFHVELHSLQPLIQNIKTEMYSRFFV